MHHSDDLVQLVPSNNGHLLRSQILWRRRDHLPPAKLACYTPQIGSTGGGNILFHRFVEEIHDIDLAALTAKAGVKCAVAV